EVLEELFKDDIVGDIPVFLVTGETDTDIWAKGYELGAMDVITKPFVAGIILRRVASLVELFRSRRSLSKTVVDHENVILQQQDKIARMGLGMVESLASVIEFRSGESGEHVRRIRDITSILLSSSIGDVFSPTTKKSIAYASILHDVGKVAIPDAILNKPGRLLPEEFEIMKKHAVYGRDMLEKIPQMREMPFFRYACDIAAYHHERWDGRGYPFGLKEHEIPLWAQIVSLADVYDALVSVRCYKKSFSHETAADMIRSGQCGVFSSELLENFFAMANRIGQLYSHDGKDIPPALF
ncbi:MAG: HD domain-containing phosphohydrolase, partial [Mailhella sp.]